MKTLTYQVTVTVDQHTGLVHLHNPDLPGTRGPLVGRVRKTPHLTPLRRKKPWDFVTAAWLKEHGDDACTGSARTRAEAIDLLMTTAIPGARKAND